MFKIIRSSARLVFALVQVTLGPQVVQERYILLITDFVFFQPEAVDSDVMRRERILAHTHITLALIAAGAGVTGLLNFFLSGAPLQNAALHRVQFTRGYRRVAAAGWGGSRGQPC